MNCRMEKKKYIIKKSYASGSIPFILLLNIHHLNFQVFLRKELKQGILFYQKLPLSIQSNLANLVSLDAKLDSAENIVKGLQLMYDDNYNNGNDGNNNGNTANNNDLLDAILKNDNVVVVVGDNDKKKDNKVIFKSDDKFRGGNNIDRNGIRNKDKEDPKLGMVRPDDYSDNQSSHTHNSNNRNNNLNNSNNNNNNKNNVNINDLKIKKLSMSNMKMKDINDIQSLRSFLKLVFSVSTLRRSDALFKHSKDNDDVQENNNVDDAFQEDVKEKNTKQSKTKIPLPKMKINNPILIARQQTEMKMPIPIILLKIIITIMIRPYVNENNKSNNNGVVGMGTSIFIPNKKEPQKVPGGYIIRGKLGRCIRNGNQLLKAINQRLQLFQGQQLQQLQHNKQNTEEYNKIQ